MKYDEYIHFGDLKHGEEFQRLDPKIKEIAYVYSFLAHVLFDLTVVTTCIFRKKTNDSGVHEQYRAIDFRLLPHIWQTYFLIQIINTIYTYDPERPALKVAVDNPFHGTGGHTHLQSHANTVAVSKAKITEYLTRASRDLHDFQPKPLGETKET